MEPSCPTCSARRTIAPWNSSVSVRRPRSRSCRVEDRALGSTAIMRRASRRNRKSGRRSTYGSNAGRSGPIATGLMPGPAHHGQRLVHLSGEQQSPATVGELFGKRQAGQRVERIAEVENELAPQHRGHVGRRGDLKTLDTQQIDQTRHICFDMYFAAGGTPKDERRARRFVLDDIERHHAGDHALRGGQRLPQTRRIAGAVLQADDCRVRRRVAGDELSHFCRVAALHRHQHEACAGKRRSRIGSSRESRRAKPALAAVEVDDRQPDLPGQRR